jgi:heme/copper-type cytochrome/quinol oxidase subunit 2
VNRRARRGLALAAAAGLFWLAGPVDALACPSCYGATEGPLIDAARVGMWLLLGVTLGVQGAFVAFFLYLRRKAREARDQALDAEWSSLQRAHDLPWRNV